MLETRMKAKRLTVSLGVMLLVMTLLLASCGSKQEKSPDGNTSSPDNITEDNDHIIPIEPSNVALLTGLKVEEVSDKRAIAVMINNMAKARPQSGLIHADMIWEVLAEGGVTRLVAIFQSDTFSDPIGPVRSIRPYLIELGESYGGILAHAGASNDAYAILQRQKKPNLDEITNAGPYFWRDKSRKAPHNLYTNLEKLREGAEKRKYDTIAPVPTYPFAEQGATEGGTPAANVALKFQLKNYKVSYTYNEEKREYARFIDDKPHTDLTSGQQLISNNLVVLGAVHEVLDDVGRLKVDLSSGGPAMLIQLGQAIECSWERGVDGVIRIVKDGAELPFVPGKTFYHIVPMKPTFAEHITLQ